MHHHYHHRSSCGWPEKAPAEFVKEQLSISTQAYRRHDVITARLRQDTVA